MGKIEFGKTGDKFAFLVGDEVFGVRPTDGAEYESQVYWMVAQYLVRHGEEVVLFSGPQERSWSFNDLVGYVLGAVDDDSKMVVANIVGEVASSVKIVNLSASFDPEVELAGEIVDELRLLWLRSCAENLSAYCRAKRITLVPEKAIEIIAQLLSACQLVFGEWLNLGEQKFDVKILPIQPDPERVKPFEAVVVH